jgi:hypothetical protein
MTSRISLTGSALPGREDTESLQRGQVPKFLKDRSMGLNDTQELSQKEETLSTSQESTGSRAIFAP